MEVSGEVADLMVKEGLEAAKSATELSDLCPHGERDRTAARAGR